MKLKVCGMKHTDNILEVAALVPDFMGFIFYKGSKRYVGEGFEMPVLPASISRVGVFVDETMETVVAMVEMYGLEYVQLHGTESEKYCKKLSDRVKVIKAFGVDEGFDFALTEKYEDSCEYFLFDTKTTDHGGSGKKFNWEVLNNYHGRKEYFLSGGLDSAYTAGLTPFAVDVNSMFEIEPGLKDIQKLKLLKDELPG